MAEDESRRKLVNNERLKLLATFVNGMGLATFAVGGLAPLITNSFTKSGITTSMLFTSLICISGAFARHYAGSLFLRRLVP